MRSSPEKVRHVTPSAKTKKVDEFTDKKRPFDNMPVDPTKRGRTKKRAHKKRKVCPITVDIEPEATQKRAVTKTPPPSCDDDVTRFSISCKESTLSSIDWIYDVGDQSHPKSVGTSTTTLKWKLEDFKFGTALGRGKFGSVYRAREKESYALKVLQKQRILSCGTAPELLKREVEIQTRLQNSNILRLFGYFHDEKSIYLVLEEAPGGELYRHVMARQPGHKLDECIATKYIRQVSSALSYLQSKHIFHRDIKPENLLLSSDRQTIKLCDFGWAIQAPPPHNMRITLCGTPEYVPPEMLAAKRINKKYYDVRYVDIWALGVLALEMVRGKTPFFANTEKNDEIFQNIREYQGVEHEDEESEEFFDFVRRLMRRRPERRMNLEEVFRHDWLCRVSLEKKKKR